MKDIANERRRVDPRLEIMAQQIASLQSEMAINTEVTKQVRDILTSFHIIAAFAKWLTIISACIAAVWTLIQKLKGGA